MSFDKVLGGDKKEDVKEKITDPKLLKYLKKSTFKASTKPDIELVERRLHKPSKTITMVFDGKVQTPEGETLEVYKCNKCGRNFNHGHAKVVTGMLPKCPDCD